MIILIIIKLVTINNYSFVNKIMRNFYYFIFINLIITNEKKIKKNH